MGWSFVQASIGKKSFFNYNFIKDNLVKHDLVYKFLQVWNVPVVIIGFLLGRAMILDSISPFALSYCAVFFYLGRRQWPFAMLSTIVGAFSLDYLHGAQTLFFLFILLVVQRTWVGLFKSQINHLPPIVLFSSLLGHLSYIYMFKDWTIYQAAVSGVDVVLSFILSFIFVYSIPLFTAKRKRISLKNEEVLCLVILLGSVLTGMMTISIFGVSLVHIVSRYIILTFAFIGGAMMGTFLGVVTGMVLSLSDIKAILQISLLSFSGLLAGIFREGKKLGVAISFLLASTLISFYDNTSMLGISFQESAISVLLFLLTPYKAFKVIAKYVPGTREHQYSHQDYIRRLRDVTACKVEQFKELFEEMAFNFREDKSKERKNNEEQIHSFIYDVMEKSCQGCHRHQACWEHNVLSTYHGITDLMTEVEASTANLETLKVPESWARYCVRSDKMFGIIKEEYKRYGEIATWQERMKDSKRVVADQLAGLSEVMGSLAGEIKHEIHVMSAHEDQIQSALEELGLSIQQVDIINLEQGKVEVEVTMPMRDGLEECKKIVAPLLTEILGEPISVFRKVVNSRSNDATILLGSAQHFEFKTSVAKAAKEGKYISGDSYCYMNLGTGKYVLALSDGMGNGGRAYEESASALKLLRKLLYAGMDFERSLDTVNAILRLRSTDEMFATIDLAVIDMTTALARFMKIGCTPGFIKRKKEVIKISVSAPPIGILQNIEMEPIEMQLQAGDLIIMMTDGIYDILNERQDDGQNNCPLEKVIAQITTKDPKDFADQLLAKVISDNEGKVHDDMTVIVSKVETYCAEWSTVNLSKSWRLDRVI